MNETTEVSLTLRPRKFAVLTLMFFLTVPGPLIAAHVLHVFGTTYPSWNPNVSCSAALTTVQEEYNAGKLAGSPWQTSSTTGGVPNKRALSPPCTVTNSVGQSVSTLVQINGVYISALKDEDCSTSYSSVNGGGPYPDRNGDGSPDSYCDTTGPLKTVGTTGSIHIEFDHDWKAKGYCGPGIPPCDNQAILSYLSTGSVSLDVQGFVYWDIDHWELHPFVAWKLSSSPAPQPLSLNVPASETANEQTALAFSVSATDDLSRTITLSATGLPSGATFPSTSGSGSVSGSFNWTPTESQGPGTYTVTFKAQDNLGASTTKSATITVNEVNSHPVVFVPGPQSVLPGNTLAFTVTATDPDIPANSISLTSSKLVKGMHFDRSTGRFTFTPSKDQSGMTYIVYFTATDNGSPSLSDKKSVSITVSSQKPPTLQLPGAQTVNEQTQLSFGVSATDSANQTVTITCSNCASLGAAFNSAPSTGSASGTFTWAPSEAQGPGTYTVTFSAADSQGLSSTGTVTVTVNEVNTAPTLNAPSTATANVGSTLTFSVDSTDYDIPSNTVTLTAAGMVTGMSFASSPGNPVSGAFSFTPSQSQAGMTFTITFTATDNSSPPGSVSKTTTVSVGSQPPQQTYALVVSADGKVLRYQDGTLTQVGQPVTTTLRQSAWKPDGSYALIVGDSAVVIKYDGNQFTMIPTGVSTTVAFQTVAWKPDGSYALMGGYDGVLLKWDGASITRLSSPVTTTIRSISWNPAGTQALAVGSKGIMFIYQASSGQSQSIVSGTTQAFYTAAWNPSGQYALVGGANGTLVKYDGTNVLPFDTTSVYGQTLTVRSIAWNSAGTLALLVGDSGLVLTYDGTTLATLPTLTGSWLYGVAWSGSVATIVGGSGAVLTYSNGTLTKASATTTSGFRGIAWKPA